MGCCFPIMVVDDDIVTRNILTKYLEKAGFDAVAASNGQEALELLDECGSRLVLTDWMMPGIDGPQLCRLIRDKKSGNYVFIILITARDSKTDIVSGLESGADDYLTKPIHPAELIARINTGLRILNLEQSLKDANEEIRLLSITDPLTSAFNRGYLIERFGTELTRAKRNNHNLSVIMTDIDYFKKVNDAYGHQVGDLVLQKFSKCMMDNIRYQIDWVVRYGGEEFFIVLPETDCKGCHVVAERLRQSVEGMKIVIDNQSEPIGITSSFGCACIDFRQNTMQDVKLEDLIRFADEQLYQSKEDGRNQVNLMEFQSQEIMLS